MQYIKKFIYFSLLKVFDTVGQTIHKERMAKK